MPLLSRKKISVIITSIVLVLSIAFIILKLTAQPSFIGHWYSTRATDHQLTINKDGTYWMTSWRLSGNWIYDKQKNELLLSDPLGANTVRLSVTKDDKGTDCLIVVYDNNEGHRYYREQPPIEKDMSSSVQSNSNATTLTETDLLAVQSVLNGAVWTESVWNNATLAIAEKEMTISTNGEELHYSYTYHSITRAPEILTGSWEVQQPDGTTKISEFSFSKNGDRFTLKTDAFPQIGTTFFRPFVAPEIDGKSEELQFNPEGRISDPKKMIGTWKGTLETAAGIENWTWDIRPDGKFETIRARGESILANTKGTYKLSWMPEMLTHPMRFEMYFDNGESLVCYFDLIEKGEKLTLHSELTGDPTEYTLENAPPTSPQQSNPPAPDSTKKP